MIPKTLYVYILASQTRVLYIGVTNDLMRRVWQHNSKQISGFTMRYNVTRLVHFETAADPRVAIAREKQLKGWLRKKKIALIEESNPEWKDLSAEWFEDIGRTDPSLRSG